MKLDGNVILVTGGSGLLGKEMIADIKRNGGIAINLDIDIDQDLNAGVWKCDITSDTEIANAVDTIYNHFRRIDGLVNNAYPRTKDWGASFEEILPDSWRRNLDWQLTSYFVITQQVLKKMKLHEKGSVVNIASIYGVVGNDMSIYEDTTIGTAPAYSAIKGGLVNFSRYLASLYGRNGIRVNCVSPGGIFDRQDPTFVKAYEKKVPMGRMGKPDDIAPVVSFLLSEEAKYITGHNVMVDGGWTAI
jgi:NAD(P)-dependent dehydrogenase (short-subunit alcohol dehydrogenase family)